MSQPLAHHEFQRYCSSRRAGNPRQSLSLNLKRPDEAARYVARGLFYERIYERGQALADLDKAISLQSSANNYGMRAALDLEPANINLTTRLRL